MRADGAAVVQGERERAPGVGVQQAVRAHPVPAALRGRPLLLDVQGLQAVRAPRLQHEVSHTRFSLLFFRVILVALQHEVSHTRFSLLYFALSSLPC